MADKDAKITIGIEGTDEVIRAAQRSKDAWTRAAGEIAGGVKSMGDQMAQGFGKLVDHAQAAASAMVAFNFAQQIAGARQFREETSRLAIASGQDITLLTARFKDVGRQILATPEQVGSFTKSLGRATYDIRGATLAAKGLGLEALNTGKSLDEMVPLGTVLSKSLGVVGDTTKALEGMRATVDSLGTGGGVVALHDQLVALAPLLSKLSADSEKGRKSIQSLGGSLKGVTEEQRTRIKASLIGAVEADPRAFERAIGVKRGTYTDEHGRVRAEQIPEILEKTRVAILKQAKRYGGGLELARQMAGTRFTREAGYELFNIDFAAEREAQVAAGRPLPRKFETTDAGRFLKTSMELEAKKRSLAEKALPYVDKAYEAVADNPWAAAAGVYFGGSLLRKLGTKAITGASSFVAGRVAGAGVGGALGAALATPGVGQALGLGLAGGAALDYAFEGVTGQDLSGRLAGMGLRGSLEAGERDPETIKARMVSTAKTIERNVGAGKITEEEGQRRLDALVAQTQRLLGVEQPAGPAAPTADTTEEVRKLPRSMATENDRLMRASPLPVFIVDQSRAPLEAGTPQ